MVISNKEIIISNTNGFYSFANDIPIDLNFLKVKDEQDSTLILRKCDIDFFIYNIIGDSNNQLSIIYNTILYDITLLEQHVYDDNTFMTNLKNTINAVIPGDKFDITKIDYTMPLNIFNRENLYHFCTYSIKTIDASVFTLKLRKKNSIGPILGFNTKTYGGHINNPDLDTYTGVHTIPLERFDTIYIHNKANYIIPLYDQFTDANCKMMLYRSDNTLIQNSIDILDATISIKYNNPTDTPIKLKNIVEYINLLEIEMNLYSSEYTPAANFEITFDYNIFKFKIKNTTGAKFGIGFDLYNDLNTSNNYGSMYSELGFDKKQYFNNTEYCSIRKAHILSNLVFHDYLLFCSEEQFYSDYNNSISTFKQKTYSVNPNDNISNNFIIFAVPFGPIDEIYFKNLESLFTTNINQKRMINNNISITKFFIRTRSGRHIRIIDWNLRFSINYID